MAIPKWNALTWTYYSVVVAAGLTVLTLTLLSGGALATPNAQWPLLVIPLILLHNTYVQLPNCDGRICPSGVFIIYAGLVWGPGPAALLAVVEAVFNSYSQTVQRAWRMVFNVTALAFAIYAATSLALWAFPRGLEDGGWVVFSRACLIAVGYYVLNMVSVLVMMALVGGRAALMASRVRAALVLGGVRGRRPFCHVAGVDEWCGDDRAGAGRRRAQAHAYDPEALFWRAEVT